MTAPWLVRRVIAAASIAAVMVQGTPSAGSSPAMETQRSATPSIKAPFECGTVWGAHTYAGHNKNAVDFNEPGTADGDRGKPVLAGANGVCCTSW